MTKQFTKRELEIIKGALIDRITDMEDILEFQDLVKPTKETKKFMKKLIMVYKLDILEIKNLIKKIK